jgi:Rnl2 family RNA ligase
MKFKHYPEIENSYREKYIAILKEHGFGDIPYVATEKIHGANFSFWTDGTEVQVATRTQFTDGGFYKSQDVIDRYSDNIMRLKNEEYPDTDTIAVYGELFGPGIQKGIYYGTEKDFMAFEIRIINSDEHDRIEKPTKLPILLDHYNIRQVPHINLYSCLDDALEESIIFTSHAYKSVYGYDAENDNSEYTEGENLAEGIVIQPADRALFTGNGARVMIKNKNPKFAEKSKRKSKGDRITTFNPWIILSEIYVNENRMNAVISKFGEVTQKDFGKIIGLMSKDVIADMIKDEELDPLWRTDEETKQLVGKGVTTNVSAFLKEHLLRKL